MAFKLLTIKELRLVVQDKYQQFNFSNFKVSYSRPNTADIKDTNLYVGNVPPGITEADLDNLFGAYGNILTKKLLKDQSGKNKG